MPFDFREPSVTVDFAKRPAGGGGVAFADYHYYEDLAGGATYTPTARAQALLCSEDGDISSSRIHVELWDGGGWVDGIKTLEDTCSVYQDDAQNLRIANGAASALKISLTGMTWTGGYTDYHYYEDMGAGVTYTPTAQSICTLASESFGGLSMHVEFWDGGGWIKAHENPANEWTVLVYQDTSQNVRVKQSSAAGPYKISLTGVIWA